MKTICFVVPSYPSVSETFVTNQIIQIKHKGYKVIVLTRKLLSIHKASQKDLLLEHDILKQSQEIKYQIPSSKLKRLIKTLVLFIKHFKYWITYSEVSLRERFLVLPFRLEFYSSFKNVDVFHIQFANIGLEISKMKAVGLLKGLVVVTFHGYDAHYKNDLELNELQEQYRILFDVSKYITVNTPYLEKKIIALGCDKTKIRVIPMGVDLDYFSMCDIKTLPISTQIKLLSIGRLIELKGFHYAIKSVKILVDRGYNVTYTIVGDGDMNSLLSNLISDLGLTKSVFLFGKKNQEEIKAILESHHIFLMSSITDETGRAEAQGLVTIEAQAMGLPVVAFDSGGVCYTIKNEVTGFLVPEKNIDAYAKTIMYLINNPEKFLVMSKASKKFVEHEFSTTLMSERFFKLYND